MLVVPAIVGVFWGAPLVARELEAGTHRLAWNQTVTRTRWLAVKVGLTGLVALAGVAVLTLVLTWWAGPIDTAISSGQREHQGLFGVPRMAPPTFGTRGIVPIGYTAFAFALGVTAGTVIRRTVPAMAVTLAVFVAVQIVMPTWVRPHLSPTQLTTTITADNLRGMSVAGGGPGVVPTGPVQQVSVEIDSPGAWVISNRTIDAAGKVAETLPNWVLALRPRAAPRRRRGRATGVLRQARQGGLPATGDLPARQPLLDLPGLRDGDLHRARTAPDRVLLLVGPPPPDVAQRTCSPSQARSASRTPGSGSRRTPCPSSSERWTVDREAPLTISSATVASRSSAMNRMS